MVEHLANLFIFIEFSERPHSKEGPFVGLGADKIYRGRIPKEPEIYYFCQLPGGGGGPLLFLKPFRTIPVLSKHVLHLVWVAHNEIKKNINKRIF